MQLTQINVSHCADNFILCCLVLFKLNLPYILTARQKIVGGAMSRCIQLLHPVKTLKKLSQLALPRTDFSVSFSSARKNNVLHALYRKSFCDN